MKNPTARINLEKVDQAFTRSVRMARYARWGIKPRNKLLGNAPTAMELATLVASLARTPSDNYEKLCGSALNLWFTSVEAISLQQNCNADYQIADAQIEAERLRLPSFTGSMSRDKFIRKMLPKISGDTYNQAKIYKDFLKDLIAKSNWIKSDQQRPVSDFTPTQDEINRLYAEHGKGQFFDSPNYHRLGDALLRWYPTYNTTEISNIRSKAAQHRWKSKKAS